LAHPRRPVEPEDVVEALELGLSLGASYQARVIYGNRARRSPDDALALVSEEDNKRLRRAKRAMGRINTVRKAVLEAIYRDKLGVSTKKKGGRK